METLNGNEELIVSCINLDSTKTKKLQEIYDIIDDIRVFGVNRISHAAGGFGISRINYGLNNTNYRLELIVPESLAYRIPAQYAGDNGAAWHQILSCIR